MGDSHSDSEVFGSSGESMLALKPKYTLKYMDVDEPNDTRTKSPKRKQDLIENTIQFTISIPNSKSSKHTQSQKQKKTLLDVMDDIDSDASDDTWYPPQHPKSKFKSKAKSKSKKEQKPKKPKEERWSYWSKQLPKEIEYCDDEIKYFMKRTIDERKEYIKVETDLLKEDDCETPPRFRFLTLTDMDPAVRLMILRKIDAWYAMEPSQSDYSKMTNWMQGLEKIPFGRYTSSIRCQIADQKTDIVSYITNTKRCMDAAVFGHEEAKEQILELIARDYSHPDGKIAPGCCIGIQGPAGNGKTTLIKDGISKALGRPFCLIGLGGAKNSSSFVGHDYTYEGGTYGRIIQALQVAKVMNPIIYFDELDKISQDSQGEEISNLLCHLTDPSQNRLFEDKYFSGIPIDLSKVMFIFAFNDESKLNPILKDRISIIRTQGLMTKQKIKIVKDYILPEVYRELPTLTLEWTKPVLEYIISEYTNKEKGVRNLKRAIYTICRKINLHLLMSCKDTKTDDEDDTAIKLFTKAMVSPETKDKDTIEITKVMVKEYLKTEVPKQTVFHGYI